MAFTLPPTLPLLASSRPLCLSSPFSPVPNRVYCTRPQTPAPVPAPVPPQYNSLSPSSLIEIMQRHEQEQTDLWDIIVQKDKEMKELCDNMDAKIRELWGRSSALRNSNDTERIVHLMEQNNKLSRNLERLIQEKMLDKFQLQVRGIFEIFVSHACISLNAESISCEGDSLQQIVRYLPKFREGLKRCSGQQSQDDLVGLLKNVKEYVNNLHHPFIKVGGHYLISKEEMENEVYAKVIEYMAEEIGLDVKVVSSPPVSHLVDDDTSWLSFDLD